MPITRPELSGDLKPESASGPSAPSPASSRKSSSKTGAVLLHPRAREATDEQRGISGGYSSAGFAVALVILLVVSVLSIRLHLGTQEESAWARHTLEVLLQSERLVSLLQDAEIAQRGYLLTGAEHYLETYQQAHRDLGGTLSALRELTADNGEQQVRLDALEPLPSLPT